MHPYDLVIHMDGDGDPILEGKTEAGIAFTKSIRGGIPDSHDLVITMQPDEFLDMLPQYLSAGILNQATGEVQKLRRPLLH